MPFASKRRPDSLELEVLRITETPQYEKQYKETPSKRKRTTIVSDKTQLTDNTLQPLQGDHDYYKQQTTSSAAKSPQQQRWYQLGNKLFRRRSSLAGIHTKRSYDEISDCSTARVEVTAKATLAKPEATVLGNSTTTILTISPTPDVPTSDAYVPDVVTALPRTNSKKRRRSKTHCGDSLFSLATINQSGEVQLHNPIGSPQSLPCDTDPSISAIKSLPLHDQVLLTTSEQTPKPMIKSNVSDNEVTVPLVKPGVKVSFISFLNRLTQWKTNNCQRNHKHPYQATVNEIVGDEENYNTAASTSLEARKSIKFSTDFQQLPALYDIKNERLPSLANVKEKGMRRLSQIRRRRSSFYYSDNERRIRANDREFNDQFKYADNFIKTSKYTMITFLPLNLLEQFQRLANFYFLCLLVLQLIPAISSLTPVTTAIPLIGVLTLTAVKDAYDDRQRHVSDSQVNNRKSKALRNGKLVEEKWSDVQVGDVIHLENNQFVAADILLLSTSEPNGLCFIETAELDGETNLKCKQCLPETNALGQEHDLLWNFNGEIICEKPNNLLNKFEGTLIWHNKRYALDNEKVLLRGCVLRNTQWCYGMVIFAGKDTKLMQNSGKTQFKSTGVDRLLNFIIIGIVLFLLSICAFFTIACALWESLIGQYFQVYLPWENIIPKHVAQGATVIGFLVFFSYAIVLNTVVPISLYVSVEVIRFVQSFLINWDEEMYYEPSKTHAKARTTTLNEELGQIQYIFSDKTGTLTQNIMTFNKCSINGRTYGDDGDTETSDIIDMEEDRKHNLVFQPNNSTTTTIKTTKTTTTTTPFNKHQLNTTNITGNIMLHKADVHEMKTVRMSSNLSKAINSLDSEGGSTNTTLLTPSIEKLDDLYKKPSILNTSANRNISPILISTPITRHSDNHAMPSKAKVKRVSYAKSRHSPIGETIYDDGMEMFCVSSATSSIWNETTKVMTLNDVANNPKMSLSDISPNQYQSSSILNTATRTRTANRQQGLEYKNGSLLNTAVAVSTIKPSTAFFSDKSTIVTHLHNSSKTDQSKSSASTLCTRFCCFCAGNRNDPSFANDNNINQDSPCCLSEVEKSKKLLVLPSTTTSAAISNTSSTHLHTNNISDNYTRTHNHCTATDSTTTIIKPICATATFSTIANEKAYYERVHAVEPVDFSANPEYEQDFRWYDKTLLDAVRSDESHSHNFFRLLALCHTVMPEYKNGRLEYQAQSPDEAALVSAARNFGFVFRSRTPNSITIEVMGRREDYTLLHILDFNNVRKRMSVLLRKGDDIILYCKGADSVIYERLSSSQTEIKAQTQDHLNKFAGEGLRTLVLAERHLTSDFYDQWSRRHHEASTSLINREEKLNALYEEVESDLLLLGVTAIEDKLQDGVPDTIRNLQMAGIKIWVLTGDKQETAINIGYSCQLLTDDLADVFIVDGRTMEEVVKQLKQFKESIRIVKRFKPSVAKPSVNGNGTGGSENRASELAPSISVVTFRWADDDTNTRNRGEPDSAETNELYDNLERAGGEKKKPSVDLNLEEEDQPAFALVVNGHALVHCLTPQLETRFLDIASQCKAVICCRVTPLQKALVVELIKRAKRAVTLAIGDGANDVSMIKAAHIGVGISGQEGLQAVLASDYSIAQFRYLERLLLVHGRWSYYRICKFLRFFFYKNFAFTLCHCWYSMFCGFSAQTVFDPMFISVYNLFYTSLPVLALGVFEQDVSDKHSLAFPKLYAPGLRSQLFNIREFVYSVLHGAFSSLILFLIPYGTYHKGVSPDGLILSDQMTLGAVVATILIIDNTAQIALYTSYWTVFNHITIWGSLIWYFVLDYFYNYVIGGPYVGALSMAMRDLTFWTTMVITVVVIMIPVLAYKFYLIDKHPSLADKVRMMRRMANLKLRQTSSVMRAPSARRSGRSLRSGYAFAHQEGFGRLITSGKIMRKLEQDFAFPLGLGSKKGANNVNNQPQDNRSNNNNTTRDSNKNASNSEINNHIGDGLNAFTKPSTDGKISPRAPCQGLDTIHL